MQVNLIEGLLQEPEKQRAEQVLNACVHCGFCTATCPTYLLQGNELDSPRGRIYLIKEMLETGAATEATRTHLDRCLTCLSCETTCPSGVEYHKLVAIGRSTSEQLVPRSAGHRALRWGLRTLLTMPGLFSRLMGVGRLFSFLLPGSLTRVYFPAGKKSDRASAPVADQRLVIGAGADSMVPPGTVLIVRGCVQPSLRPETDAALEKILHHCDIPVRISAATSCCGAASFHTSGEAQARSLARTNIDAWWPLLEQQGEGEPSLRGIVSTASGCGVHLKDYPHLLADDPEYRDKAEKLVALIRDPVELLESVFRVSKPAFDKSLSQQNLVFHCPCTLQHGQQLPGRVERLLTQLGVSLPVVADSHLCCGSAGTYSVLQPTTSKRLREQKLQQLQASEPDTILTANIGCQLHLQGGTEKPVRHWLKILADALPGS